MTGNARAGRRILGSLRSADGKGVVRMEDRFDTDIEDLSVGTHGSRPSRPLARRGRGRPAPWRRVPRTLRSSGWEGTGRIEACEPPRRLLVLTKDADAPDAPAEHTIEAMLIAEGDQTILVSEERGMPLELLAAYGAGIQIHVEDLAAHIAGHERSDDAEARWQELLPAYQDLAAGVS